METTPSPSKGGGSTPSTPPTSTGKFPWQKAGIVVLGVAVFAVIVYLVSSGKL